MVAFARADLARDAVDDLVDEYQATADAAATEAAVGADPRAETEPILRAMRAPVRSNPCTTSARAC